MNHLFFTLMLSACREDKISTNQEGNTLVDEDADGFLSNVDCDDANADIHPEAEESCDGLDNNCDGIIDDDDSTLTDGTTWFLDSARRYASCF